MIRAINLLRNIGQFESVSTGQALPLGRLALIYAENGRGKTTLAAVFRSLGLDDPGPILERHRLGAQNPPHVVLAGMGVNSAMFQNSTWQGGSGNVLVFDDTFVVENVCSGMRVETEHRSNLHELIIGGQGVILNAALQAQVDRIEQHNRDLQRKGNSIPAHLRGVLTVDAFCALQPRENLDGAIRAAEQNLAAGREADAIRDQRALDPVALFDFDLGPIEALLARHLPDLEAAAAQRVQGHLRSLGRDGETWVGSGLGRIRENECPFCAQSLNGSPLIAHYQAYFSETYRGLKSAIDEAIRALTAAHSGDVVAAFERNVAQAAQGQQFWARFTPINAINIDTAALALARRVAFEAVLSVLQAKQSAPLERMSIDGTVTAAVAAYRAQRRAVTDLNTRLVAANSEIALVKERAASANVAALERDLSALVTERNRLQADVMMLCDEYLAEKGAKTATEQQREAARTALDAHRTAVFPNYEQAINRYLQRFNAGFRLGSVTSVNTRAGASCNYTVLINAHAVPLSGASPTDASFRNTMSSGDRNTLALAFFFAKLESEPNLAQTVVVIDDPMTSLDEHRSLATIQELRRLDGLAGQLIVLSHSKPFLCAIWQGADITIRTAMRIARANQSSTLAAWDVNQDCITEHDRRHQLVSRYIENSIGINEREVAAALRSILEAFIRVAYPIHFPPGTLLGSFIGLSQSREGTSGQILTPQIRAELRFLLDYANRFHHDTNAAWQTEIINDHELLDFSRRTLVFAAK
ncbi:MAG: AAA family ATPase [Anaerolineaceae bacterium]